MRAGLPRLDQWTVRLLSLLWGGHPAQPAAPRALRHAPGAGGGFGCAGLGRRVPGAERAGHPRRGAAASAAGVADGDEQVARRQDVRQRQRGVQRQIGRLIDEYMAGVLSLEELSARRWTLGERLVALRQDEQRGTADALRDEQLQEVAASLERFREHIAQGLAQADFTTRRAIVELLVDRVVVDAPEVEVRYVMTLTGVAQRKGVLRPHY